MKLTRIPRYLNRIYSHPEIITDSKKYLFLISHMRSFSTLISHLLGSSDEINGYKENHLSYSNAFDLYHLRYKTQKAIEADLNGTYIHDKILHNYNVISENLLKRPDLHLIFTIRKPVDTVKSIINMGTKLVDVEWYRDPHRVADYYEKRLEQMCKYAPAVKERGIYIDAEAIIEDSDSVVNKLTDWLHLKEPLSTEYETFKHSGKPWHGDPSKNIMEGKIVKKKKDYQIDLPQDVIDRVNHAYDKARYIITEHCTELVPRKAMAK